MLTTKGSFTTLVGLCFIYRVKTTIGAFARCNNPHDGHVYITHPMEITQLHHNDDDNDWQFASLSSLASD